MLYKYVYSVTEMVNFSIDNLTLLSQWYYGIHHRNIK